MLKMNISDFCTHTKIKIHSNSSLVKTLNKDNVMILIKSVFNKNYNDYYYQVLLIFISKMSLLIN